MRESLLRETLQHRRSNRPGNSQVNGPHDRSALWKARVRLELATEGEGWIYPAKLSGFPTEGARNVHFNAKCRAPHAGTED
jgi:hypothetical protein